MRKFENVSLSVPYLHLYQEWRDKYNVLKHASFYLRLIVLISEKLLEYDAFCTNYKIKYKIDVAVVVWWLYYRS